MRVAIDIIALVVGLAVFYGLYLQTPPQPQPVKGAFLILPHHQQVIDRCGGAFRLTVKNGLVISARCDK